MSRSTCADIGRSTVRAPAGGPQPGAVGDVEADGDARVPCGFGGGQVASAAETPERRGAAGGVTR
ncbi:hypothetical protein [Streptomyces akebiae]|uniref:Uncharacterized protein n=1 Tax=Streptomyces akebiae TaxID=2865673 RepID=A0ABX8Y440_9ACTN|nr:hypothetical protein [Streptomyces akebiae]QYX82504.1 hypothetical protein K1J60_43485 [Streptomyces akebiae]